jgi:cytochrome c-type biogenesis protein CcmH/NrfG
MNTGSRKRRGATTLVFTLLVVIASNSAGCRRETQKATQPNVAGQTASAQPGGDPVPADITKLNGDIERLEKQAERNPADEETQDELARTYVRRAKVEQAGGQYQEALVDYQSALRHDPDNDEAQAGAAAVDQQLGGDQQEDENGAPAPLPITPGVADENGKPTPTPKKP